MKMAKTLLIICFFSAAGFFLQAETSAEEAAARKALEEYLLAWEYKDYELMYELIPAGAATEMKKAEFVGRMKNTTYFPVDFSIARIRIEGGGAKIWVDLYEKKDADVRKETITLVKEGASWKVEPLYLSSLESLRSPAGAVSGGRVSSPSGGAVAGGTQGGSILSGMDTQKVLEKMIESGKAINDIQCQVAISMPAGGFEVTMTGSLIFKNPNKARIDISAPVPLEIITNGKMLWIYVSAMNSVYQNDVSGMQQGENLILGFGDSREDLLTKYDAQLIGQASVAARPAYLLNFIPKQASEKLKLQKVELYVDAKSFIPVKTVAHSAGNRVEMTFMGIDINTGAQDSLFDFQVPPGTSISEIPLVEFF